jgi:hypothetical protein
MPCTFKWDNMSIVNFQAALARADITKKVNDFLKLKVSDVETTIDKSVNNVTNILLDAASISLKMKSKNVKSRSNKKWYDKELTDLKKEVLYNSHALQRFPNIPEIRRAFFVSLKQYNRLKKRKRRKFKEYTLRKLDELRVREP